MYSDKSSLDKFYTKPSVAISCLSLLNLSEYDAIIEPSAGSGSFFNNITHPNKIGLDLAPEENLLIEKQDWFEYRINQDFRNVLIVGNPPFGKRNKLSIDFIKHAASFNNVKCIAFVLPNVFNKHTLQKHIPDRFRLKEVLVLPRDSFTLNNEDYHVPCSFYIFEESEGDCLRFNPELFTETEHFTYGTRDNSDFFVMGAAPKVLKSHSEVNPNNRGNWILVKDGFDVEEVKNNFLNTNWVGNSSANGGVFWLTRPEMIKIYQEQNSGNLKKTNLSKALNSLFEKEDSPQKISKKMLLLNPEDWTYVFTNKNIPLHIEKHIHKYFKVTKNKHFILEINKIFNMLDSDLSITNKSFEIAKKRLYLNKVYISLLS